MDQKTHERMERLRATTHKAPSGNVFRGWALGLHCGLQELLLATAILMVQLLAPPILAYFYWKELQRSGGFQFISVKDHDSKNSSMYLLNMKVLGTILMGLLYFNFDHLFEKQAAETRELCRRCKVNRVWMFVDSFSSLWCFLGCSILLPLLFFHSPCNKLILGAFGLLFISKLDDYAGVIVVGFNDGDFQQAMKITEEDEHDEWSWWSGGAALLSLGRFLNIIVMCFCIPLYMLVWYSHEIRGGGLALEPLMLDSSAIHVWGAVIFCAVYLVHGVDWFNGEHRDGTSFLYQVILRTRDPRTFRPDPKEDAEKQELPDNNNMAERIAKLEAAVARLDGEKVAQAASV